MMRGKISVIGGSGFVGTSLCRLLTQHNRDFEIVDIKKSNQFPENYKYGDVRDLQSMRDAVSGDIVVNLAAVHRDDVKDKSEYWETNVEGANNIACICTELNIKKIIFTSSVAVYGFAKPGTDESGKINPFNEYGKTKFEAEKRFEQWHKTSEDNSLIIVRPTVIFGEGNRGNVYNLFRQIASRKFLMVGDGKNKKSLAYILNIVEFLDHCINTDTKYGVINYVDTPDFTMNELVSEARKLLTGRNGVGVRLPLWLGITLGHSADVISYFTKKNLPISAIRVKKFVSSSEFKSAKENLHGFSAPFKLDEAVKRTLQSEFINPDPSREIFFTE